MLLPGRYAVAVDGGYRVFQVTAANPNGKMRGRTILKYPISKEWKQWRSFGFLLRDNTIQFFVQFQAEVLAQENGSRALAQVREHLAEIARDPGKAAQLYQSILFK